MDINQAALGVVLFVVFWAFQAGYVNTLGTSAWFLGVIIFAGILWLIGKSTMPKQTAEFQELWMFTTGFAVVATFVISYLGPTLGAVFPSGLSQEQLYAALTPLVLSLWLIVFGGSMFVTGWQAKWGVTTLTGIIWLFSAMHFVTATSTGANSYLHFGLLVGLPFIIYGLIVK